MACVVENPNLCELLWVRVTFSKHFGVRGGVVVASLYFFPHGISFECGCLLLPFLISSCVLSIVAAGYLLSITPPVDLTQGSWVGGINYGLHCDR